MKRKNKKIKIYKCPCCNLDKTKDELSYVISRSEMIASDMRFCEQCWGGIESRQENPFYLPYNRWACDNCINSKVAKLANPSSQNYQEDIPYFAYFDKEFTCKSCNVNFLFSKKEQYDWFERWNFWVTFDSFPKNCPNCRKENKYQKNLQKNLMELLKSKDTKNIDVLKKISVLYAEMGNKAKSELYTKRIKNINTTHNNGYK